MKVAWAMRLAGVWLLSMQLAACANSGKQVELAGHRFEVELVVTRDEQAMGLMFRESMADNQAMLFVFGSEGPRSFWMKNTRIPLDILYFDSNFILVSMAQNARPCAAQPCPAYPSERPAQYVLEINGGLAAELGIQEGDELLLQFDL